MNIWMRLTRWAYAPVGTFGSLQIMLDDEVGYECFTVERPWLNNERNVSCIPRGTYVLSLGFFHRGGYEVYEVQNVPSRSLIKIHKGNTMDDLKGCIAPGKGLGFINDKWAVSSSAVALSSVMDVMDNTELSTIVIQNTDELS